jgi:DNA-binding HxlR family transcriptional regulator
MAGTDSARGYTLISRYPGEPCSGDVGAALKALEGHWKLVIILHLFRQPVSRLSELHRAIPAVTQKMLIQQLRALEDDGIVDRTVYVQMPPKVEHRPTERGIVLAPVFSSLLEWASTYPQR